MRTIDALLAALQRAGLPAVVLQAPGGARAVVAPGLGAKVLGAGVDEENAFWVPDELAAGQWCVGGQRSWLAPELGPRGFFGRDESSWAVDPELDPGAYRPFVPVRPKHPPPGNPCAFEAEMILTRADGTVIRVAMTREIFLQQNRAAGGPPALRLRVRHTLVNRDERILEQEAGLWGILQVPIETEGTILVPLRSGPDPRLYFGELPSGWLRRSVLGTRRLLYLRARAGQRYKLGVPAVSSCGVLAFVRPSGVGPLWTLVVQRSTAETTGTYLDRPPGEPDGPGDALQCYNHSDPNLAFSELECHAPARRLAPGGRQSASVDYLILKGPRGEMLAAAGRETGCTVDSRMLFG